MQAEPVIYREEVTAILIAFADVNVKLDTIIDLLRDDDEEEEEERDFT